MRKLLLLFMVLCIILLSCSDVNDRFSINLDDFYGVWANENCELVQTGKYELLFERLGSKIYCSIRAISIDKDKIHFTTLGAVEFDKNTQEAVVKAYDLVTGDTLFINNDNTNSLIMIDQICKIKHYPEKIIITSKGNTIGELAIAEKQFRLQFPSGNWQTLELVEKINISGAYIPIKADSSHLGAANHQWRLGTSYQRNDEDIVNTIEIGTNKHSFVFSVNKYDEIYFAYCRAARIKSNNHGTVFAQNIRLMNRANMFTAYMPSDNYQTIRKDLVIEDSLFNPKECIYAEKAIYWSVKEFNDTMIVLNGCGGEDYHCYRPNKTSPNIVEWFEYVDY